MLDRIDADLFAQRTALAVRGYRQELLASNIANVDTPHYKARDVDFRTAFAGALQGRGGDLALDTTSAAHLNGGGGNGFGGFVQYRTEFQSAVDGNTVNMDIERAEFADNALHMEASLTFIREQLRMLNLAVQA